MDISGLSSASLKERADKGFELKIHDPSFNPTDIVITIAGMHSERYQNATLIYQDTDNPDKMMSELKKLYASAVISWENIGNPEPLECNMENAVALFEEYTWIADQVAGAVRDHTNFISRDSSS